MGRSPSRRCLSTRNSRGVYAEITRLVNQLADSLDSKVDEVARGNGDVVSNRASATEQLPIFEDSSQKSERSRLRVLTDCNPDNSYVLAPKQRRRKSRSGSPDTKPPVAHNTPEEIVESIQRPVPNPMGRSPSRRCSSTRNSRGVYAEITRLVNQLADSLDSKVDGVARGDGDVVSNRATAPKQLPIFEDSSQKSERSRLRVLTDCNPDNSYVLAPKQRRRRKTRSPDTTPPAPHNTPEEIVDSTQRPLPKHPAADLSNAPPWERRSAFSHSASTVSRKQRRAPDVIRVRLESTSTVGGGRFAIPANREEERPSGVDRSFGLESRILYGDSGELGATHRLNIGADMRSGCSRSIRVNNLVYRV